MSHAYRTLILQQKAKGGGRSRGPRPPARRVVIKRGSVFLVNAPQPSRSSMRGGSSDLMGAASFGKPRTWSRRRKRIPRDWPEAFPRR